MNKKYNLTIYFPTKFKSTLGIESRLEIMRYFSQHFKTTILTNNLALIRDQVPLCKVIEIKQKKNKAYFPFQMIPYWINLAFLINNIKSDIVFMFEYCSEINHWIKYPSFIYISQFGIRYVRRSSFKFFFRIIYNFFDDMFIIRGMKKSSLNFAVSQPIIDLLKFRGVRNLILIHHALNLKKFQEPLMDDIHLYLKYIRDEGYFIVAYSGTFDPNRGVDLMLDSFKQSVELDKKIFFVFAGANEDYSKMIKNYCEYNHLDSNIINYGKIDSSLIPGILHLSDICLSFLEDIPAHRISPPQKVIEYFVAGKPVICNKIEPHEWLVENRKTGFILDLDAQQVANAIVILKNDKELYKYMSENAKQESLKYDINIVYKKMIDEMENVIKLNTK